MCHQIGLLMSWLLECVTVEPVSLNSISAGKLTFVLVDVLTPVRPADYPASGPVSPECGATFYVRVGSRPLAVPALLPTFC
jgi:hypothetical protein